MSQQLPLDMHLKDNATFENFYWGRDIEVQKAIEQFTHFQGEPFLYLWGSSGCGRSHLLQAVCQSVTPPKTAIYLPLKECVKRDVSMLEGIENIHLVCLDDITAISGQVQWEEAVFVLFNQIKALGHSLLISSVHSPMTLPIKLQDLKSRLSSGLTYQLHPLSDEEKEDLLRLRAEQRGFQLDHLATHYLLQRCQRHSAELFQVLDTLDKASLSQQRKITIPFIKKVLNL